MSNNTHITVVIKSILILMLILLNSNMIFASDYKEINSIITDDDFNEIQKVLDEDIEYSFKEVFIDIFTGKDISDFNFIVFLSDFLLRECRKYTGLFVKIIVIAILQSILSNLKTSLELKSVSNLCTYVIYTVFIITIIEVIGDSMSIIGTYLDFIVQFVYALIPVYVSVLSFNLQVSTALTLSPIILFYSNVVLHFYKNILLNIVYVFSIMNLINILTEKSILDNFIEISLKLIRAFIKYVTIGFIGIISLMGVYAPISSNLAVKTGKYFIKGVPIVGNTLESAMDTYSLLGDVTKNTFVTTVVIFSLLYAFIYIVQVVIKNLVLYASSIVVSVVTDKKITRAINNSIKFLEIYIAIGFSTFIFVSYSIIVIIFI